MSVPPRIISCEPNTVAIVTDGKHKAVPQEIFQEAEQYAKVGTVVSFMCNCILWTYWRVKYLAVHSRTPLVVV